MHNGTIQLTKMVTLADSPADDVHSGKNDFLRSHIASQRVAMCVVIAMSFLRSCSGFFLTVIIGEFFMLQFKTGSSKGRLLSWFGIHLHSVNQFFLLFSILLVANFIVSYFEKYYLMRQGEIFVQNVREVLFASQITNQIDRFNAKHFGSYLLRYSNDMKAVQNYLTKGIFGGIADTIFVSIGLLLLIKIHWLLGTVTIALFLQAAIIIFLLSLRQKKFIRQSRDKRSNLLAYVTKTFSRFERIKKLEREDITISNFRLKSSQLFKANLENGKAYSLIQSTVSFTYFLIVGLILWMISNNNIHISSADGLVAILILMLLRGGLRRLFGISSIINKWKISITKIEILMKGNGSEVETVLE